ncbi:unnamed protein product, partial [Ectocarpus sp. 8 AP-2014]
MAKDRLEEHPIAQEQSEFFCLEVYVADVESCSFSHTSVTPTVILSLLDFEPLVFDLSRTPPAQRQVRRKRGPGFREVPQWDEEDDQHDGIGTVESANNTCRASSDGAQRDDHLFNNRKSKTTATTRGKHASYADSENGQHHPKPFFCSKGKSCIFTANPADLSRALQNQNALTFLVASKLSQRQAAIHGSCAIDLSTFGPNAELSHALPRAVSCWGHRTTRVESKDLKGATVARAGLTISLSCLGATGSLIHLTPARTGATSHRASGNGNLSAAAPPRPDHSTPDRSTPGGLPMVHDQWTTESAQLGAQARGHAPVAKQPGTNHLMCSHTEAGSSRCGDGRTKESVPGAGGTSAGAECWTCEYNPRDGRLVGPTSSAAAVVEPAAAAATAAGRDVSDADLAPKRGGAVSPGDPCPAVEEETGAAAAVGGPPGDSAGAEADDNDDAETDTKTSPVRLSVAASVSKNDWLGLPGGDSRLQETPLQTEGCCSLDENGGGGKKPDEIAKTEEEGKAGAGQGRNKAARNFPGNNRLVTSWRPGAVPSHHEEGIVFDRRSAAVPSVTATAPGRGGPRNATRRSTKSATATARQKRCDYWLRRRGARPRASKDGCRKPSARAPTTATTEAPLQGGRGGETARRAWGAGPGAAVSATATAVSGSGGISRTRASQEGRGRGNEARHSERGRLAREPRPWSAKQRSAALGPAALQQFLPTWTSLVAEAAWLRGARSSAERGEGGFNDGGGGNGDGDDHANVAQHNRTIGELGTAETTTGKHNDWRPPKAPLPLLDPSVERCLMGWLRARVDRNGAVADDSTGERATLAQAVRDDDNNAPPDDRSCCSSNSSPPTKTTLQQPQDQHRHHQRLHPQQQQQQRQDRRHQRSARGRRTAERDDSAAFGQKRKGDDVEGTAGGGVPASCGIATTEGRLYELFEDALKSLVEEGKAASAPGETVRGRRTCDSSSSSSGSAATRVGWMEVVRRVSSLSERTRVDATVAEEEQHPPPRGSAPATSAFRPREGQEELRRQPRDNGHPAQQTDKGTDGGVGPDQRKGAGSSSASSSRSSAVCAVEKSPLRPPPISIQPYRRLSPPPRLPPLNTRSPSPPLSPPPKVLAPAPLAAGLVRPSPSPRQRRAATTASPTTIAPTEAATAAPVSPRSPTCPRASLW